MSRNEDVEVIAHFLGAWIGEYVDRLDAAEGEHDPSGEAPWEIDEACPGCGASMLEDLGTVWCPNCDPPPQMEV